MWYRGSDYEADLAAASEEDSASQPTRPHLRLVSDSDG